MFVVASISIRFSNKTYAFFIFVNIIYLWYYNYRRKEIKVKQVIYVTTMDEAITMAMKLSSEYAVLVAENEYNSDKDFEGVIIYVK